MLSRYRYFIVAAIVLFMAVFNGFTRADKDEVLSGVTAAIWLGLAAFWAWVYFQTKSRKLFVSKMLTIIAIVSIIAAARHALNALNLLTPEASVLITFTLSLLVASETYDLWVKAGRDSKLITNPDTDKNKE